MRHHDFNLCVQDTDSISFSKKNKEPFTKSERQTLLDELNGLMTEGILWEDDEHFKTVIAVAAKNYVLDNGEIVKIKGSGLKATKKEPILRVFIKEFIDLLLNDNHADISDCYKKYVKQIMAIGKNDDVSDWCFKITATKKILQPGKHTFSVKALQALIDAKIDVIEGDKYYMFFREDDSLCVREAYNGDIKKTKLLEKLFATAKTFHRVYDIKQLPNYKLRKNQLELEALTKTTIKRPVRRLK